MPTPAIQAIILGAPIRVEMKAPQGPGGKSAYQIAVENGFEGTEAQWLASLVGPDTVTSATTSDGTANLSISNVTTATATVSSLLTANHIHGNIAGTLYTHVRTGEAVSKGDPVYVSGFHNGTGQAIVMRADASDAGKMPAIGVMDAAYAQNISSANCVIAGTITSVDTDAFSINSPVYVGDGGGFSETIGTIPQQVGIVERSNTNNGAFVVTNNKVISFADVLDAQTGTATLNLAGATIYPNGSITYASTNSGGAVGLSGQLATDFRNVKLPNASGNLALVASTTGAITSADITDATSTPTLDKIVKYAETGNPAISAYAFVAQESVIIGDGDTTKGRYDIFGNTSHLQWYSDSALYGERSFTITTENLTSSGEYVYKYPVGNGTLALVASTTGAITSADITDATSSPTANKVIKYGANAQATAAWYQFPTVVSASTFNVTPLIFCPDYSATTPSAQWEPIYGLPLIPEADVSTTLVITQNTDGSADKVHDGTISGATTFNTTSYTYGTGAAAAHRTALGVVSNTDLLSSVYEWSKSTADYTPTNVGTGTSSTATNVMQLNTLAQAGSSALLRSDANDFRAWQKYSGNRQAVDWSKKTMHFVRISSDAFSGADTIFRIYLGLSSTLTTVQDLQSANTAIGFKVINGVIFVQVSNGSAVTTTTTGVTMSAWLVYDCMIQSNGDGTWTATVNSTTVTGSGAPTTTSAASNAALIMSATNGTTSSARRFFINIQRSMQHD
jgi:hypothetical protein